MKTLFLACSFNNLLKCKKNYALFLYDYVCGHESVCVNILKYLGLCDHKRMAHFTLTLKAIMHAGKCEKLHGG